MNENNLNENNLPQENTDNNAVQNNYMRINQEEQAKLQSMISEMNYEEEKEKKKGSNIAVVLLIISIANLVFLAPGVFYFGVIWLIFGAFSNDAFQYYAILLGCCGYFSASIVGLIAFIINVIKKGKVLGKCLITVLIAFILGIILPIALAKSDYSPNKSEMKKNDEIVEKVVYQDEDLTIKQIKIEYNKTDIKLYFSMNSSEEYFKNNINYIKARVDKCIVHSVSVNKENDLYYISIPYNSLNNYNIKDIHEIDFKIRNKRIRFDIDSNSYDIINNLKLTDKDILYSNEYFKMYYQKKSSGYFNIIIESLIPDDYTLDIHDADFDTPGYMNMSAGGNLYDYSIIQNSIYYYPCENNLSYMKFEYVIRDGINEITKDQIEEKFAGPKIKPKSTCS